TSTDAERAFSEGRRGVNFLQHNMSSQTFRGEMALGSWNEKPFVPDLPELISILKLARLIELACNANPM
ncbi:hypothetical protein B0H13DRAFT_1633734, partial [Mycena leptocephala]